MKNLTIKTLQLLFLIILIIILIIIIKPFGAGLELILTPIHCDSILMIIKSEDLIELTESRIAEDWIQKVLNPFEGTILKPMNDTIPLKFYQILLYEDNKNIPLMEYWPTDGIKLNIIINNTWGEDTVKVLDYIQQTKLNACSQGKITDSSIKGMIESIYDRGIYADHNKMSMVANKLSNNNYWDLKTREQLDLYLKSLELVPTLTEWNYPIDAVETIY